MQQLATMSELSEFETSRNEDISENHHKELTLNDETSRFDKSSNFNMEMTMKTAQEGESTSRISLSPRIKELLFNELKSSSSFSNCPEHIDEELQFYCFETDKMLCAECVVSGKYAKHQLVNLKKASVKIAHKINDLLNEMDNKILFYKSLNQNIERRKQTLSKTLSVYKEEIIESMNELRRRIDATQEKLLGEFDQLRKEKLSEIETAHQKTMHLHEDIENVKNMIEGNLRKADEKSICQYYSTKIKMAKSYMEDEETTQSQNILLLSEQNDFYEHFSLNKFQEELQLITIQLKSLRGIEDLKEMAELLRYSPTRLGQSTLQTLETHDKEEEMFFEERDEENEFDMNSSRNFHKEMAQREQREEIENHSHHLSSPLSFSPLKKALENDRLSFRSRSHKIFQNLDTIFEARNESDRRNGTQRARKQFKIFKIDDIPNIPENTAEIREKSLYTLFLEKRKQLMPPNSQRNLLKDKLFVKTYNNILTSPTSASICTSATTASATGTNLFKKSYIPQSTTSATSDLDRFLLTSNRKGSGSLLSPSSSIKENLSNRSKPSLKQKFESITWVKPNTRSFSLRSTNKDQAHLRNSSCLSNASRVSRTSLQWADLFRSQLLK